MDTSDLMPEIDGWVPWLPHSLSDAQTVAWAEGLKWEFKYYKENFQIKTKDLPEDVRKARHLALLTLFQVTTGNPEPLFHQTVLAVDRLLLTQGLPPNITMEEAVVACNLKLLLNYRGSDEVAELADNISDTLKLAASGTELMARAAWVEEVLGTFSTCDLHPAHAWFHRMSPVGSFSNMEIHTVFVYLGLDGSLATHPPSSVAAAVLLKFMGRQAEPFLYGYDEFDLAVVTTEVDRVLDVFA